MLCYNRIDISKGIDLAKSNNSNKLLLFFFNHEFNFQDSICNGCHDLIILSVSVSNIAIITILNVDFCCIIVANLKQLIY